MSITDLLPRKRRRMAKHAQIIRKLEADIEEQKLTIETAQHTANSSRLEAEESTTGPARVRADADRAELIKEQNRLAELTGALLAARQREEADEAIRAEGKQAESWTRTEKLARDYDSQAVALETMILNLSDSYQELLRTGEAIYAAAPVRGAKLHNSGLGSAQVEKDFRLFMHKRGFKWSASYPWNPDDIAHFSDQAKAATRAVLAVKAKETTAA
jgi:hypothetical protein